MHWRYRWRLWFHKKSDRSHRLMRIALLWAGIVLLFIHLFNIRLRPQLIFLAESQLRNQVTYMAEQAMVESLYEQGLSYTDLVTLQTGKSGEITTLSTDTIRLNGLRSVVMDKIVSGVRSLDAESLGVPLGLLTGIDILSAIGPRVPIRILSVASATGSYRNDFISAGINQTLHRIFLDVTITARILLPGGSPETEILVPVSIVETVIIGQVPQTYLNMNP